MKNTRNAEVYKVASKYAQALLGYKNAHMRATEAYNAVSAIAKKNGWTLKERESVWNSELRYALKFWDVPVENLMAFNC